MYNLVKQLEANGWKVVKHMPRCKHSDVCRKYLTYIIFNAD